MAPLTLVCFTSTGEPIVARIGLETSRLSAASRAKRATWVSATRSGAFSGRLSTAASMIVCERRRPRMSTVPTSGSATSPPVTITSM